MIDLNRKPKHKEPKEEPLGVVLWMLMPVALGFWWMLIQAFVH